MVTLSSLMAPGLDPADVQITGGSINGTTIGATTPAPATFTTITLNGVTYSSIDPNITPTVITSAHTATVDEWLLINTTIEPITVTLPTGADGDVIRLTDFAGTWETNNVTLTGGSFLDASGVIQTDDFVLDLSNFDVTAVYHTGAWRIR